MIKPVTVTVTTNGSGAGSTTTPDINGRVLVCIYTKHGTTPFADGVDFSINTETSDAVWTESNVNASAARYTRRKVLSDTAANTTYNGTHVVEDCYVRLADQYITVAVTSGGATKTGTFTFLVDDGHKRGYPMTARRKPTYSRSKSRS